MHPSLLPYHPDRDVYRLLQVDSTASREEVLAACRRLARTFHPDHNLSPRANEEMGVINAVRDLLTTPHERAAYDRARTRFLSGRTPGTAGAARSAGSPRYTAASAPILRLRRYSSVPAAVERTLRALVTAFRTALSQFGLSDCPNCGGMAAPEYLFCASCGSRLRRVRRLSFS
ncbi:MAG TPA: DnaJ domain-containing protein [Candidatus Limnocylindria bacterium]|nr:DnaJ domain-containing protein [Candidatus Limnocylindria bacterium]